MKRSDFPIDACMVAVLIAICVIVLAWGFYEY